MCSGGRFGDSKRFARVGGLEIVGVDGFGTAQNKAFIKE